MALVAQSVPLVLASGSSIRAQMLKSVGLQFSVVPSSVDEAHLKGEMVGMPVAEQAKRLAREKCLSVAQLYPNHVTIGADQMCELDGVIFDKPLTRSAAIDQLTRLAGQSHRQHSAICLAQGDQLLWGAVEQAVLTMRALTTKDIASYIDFDQPLQSCGSYRLEGMGRHLFASIEGDHDVIKGLPLTALLLTLYELKLLSFN